MSDGRLTSSSFWDAWWSGRPAGERPDRRLSHDRAFMDLFERHLAPGASSRVFEVGCAPGKWLSYFHAAFGCRVGGCELSPVGAEAARRNLAAAGARAEVLTGDFLSLPPSPVHDVVLSLGFIEHFEDPMPVFARHLDWLAPGGVLVLEVPNFRSVNGRLQSPSLLAAHNLAVMSEDFFRRAAAAHGARLLRVGYFGGLEPALWDPRGRPWPWRAAAKALAGLRRLPGAGRVDSPLWSGFLAGFFEKPGGAGPSVFRP